MKDVYNKLRDFLNIVANKYAMVLTLIILIASVYRLIMKYLLLGQINAISLIICFVSFAWLIPIIYQYILNFRQKKLIKLNLNLKSHISFIAILLMLAFNMIMSDSELLIASTVMMSCMNLYFLYMFKSPYIVNDGLLFGALRKWQDIDSYIINGNQIALVFKTDNIIKKGQKIDLVCEQVDVATVKNIFLKKIAYEEF